MTFEEDVLRGADVTDLEAMPSSQLIQLFRQVTGRPTKKFASRGKGVQQTLRALREWREANPPTKSSRPRRGTTARRGMSFRFRPPVTGQLYEPRGKRGRLLELLRERGSRGVALSEVQERFGWKETDAYEALRILHYRVGIGLWHERQDDDYLVREVTVQEFDRLVEEANW